MFSTTIVSAKIYLLIRAFYIGRIKKKVYLSSIDQFNGVGMS